MIFEKFTCKENNAIDVLKIILKSFHEYS